MLEDVFSFSLYKRAFISNKTAWYLFCLVYLPVAGWKIRLLSSRVRFVKAEFQGMWSSLVRII